MDIIKIPKYKDNKLSPWSNYEKSYLNNNYLNEYKIQCTNINNYIEEFDKIMKNRNNFYKLEDEIVLSTLLKKLNNLYLSKFKDSFKNEIIDFIKSEKANTFICSFIKSIKYDMENLMLIINELPNDNFLKDLKKTNNLILVIENLNDMDHVINKIYFHMSESIAKNFTNFINGINLKILSNLFQQLNILKKFYKNLAVCFKKQVISSILDKIVNNLNGNNISNVNLANNVIIIFDFLLLNVENNTVENINENNDYSFLLDYLCASIYFWIIENNYSNIKNLILFCYYYLPNKLDFLEYYKVHLQNRSLIVRNYNLEDKCFQKIVEVFDDEEFKKNIYEIRYILDDIYVSNICNDELNDLSVNRKYKFQNIDYDLKKCNTLICSSNLWNSNKNLYDGIKYVDNISIYDCILKKYYDSKFSKRRKLNISYEESIINFRLFNNILTMPLSYYNLFYKIGEVNIEVSKNTFIFLNKTLNYETNYLKKILDMFKSKNLIKEVVIVDDIKLRNYINEYFKRGDLFHLRSLGIKVDDINLEELCDIFYNYMSDNNLVLRDSLFRLNMFLIRLLNVSEDVIYVINDDLEYQELNINLSNMEKYEKINIEKVEYDRNSLLDCKISKLLKREVELSYGRLLIFLRNDINKYFVPSENDILSRLNRLEILGYICKTDNIYRYIE